MGLRFQTYPRLGGLWRRHRLSPPAPTPPARPEPLRGKERRPAPPIASGVADVRRRQPVGVGKVATNRSTHAKSPGSPYVGAVPANWGNTL
jgi:hypothetical protein